MEPLRTPKSPPLASSPRPRKHLEWGGPYDSFGKKIPDSEYIHRTQTYTKSLSG